MGFALILLRPCLIIPVIPTLQPFQVLFIIPNGQCIIPLSIVFQPFLSFLSIIYIFIDRKRFWFRTLEPVPKDTELCFSYLELDVCYELRQKKLENIYHFICRCYRCQIERSLEQAEEEEEQPNDRSRSSTTATTTTVTRTTLSNKKREIDQFLKEITCSDCGGIWVPHLLTDPQHDATNPPTRMEYYCNGCSRMK